MKKLMVPFCICLFCCIALLQACTSSKKAARKKYPLIITNPSSIERTDELVILSREFIEQKTGVLAPGKYMSITKQSNEAVIVQSDDLNKDGTWDEIAFLYNFQPNETVRLGVAATTRQINKSVVRAHVRMRKKNTDNSFGPQLDSVTVPGNTAATDFTRQKSPSYLTEGPAWENDKVAFRIYLDARNTKDIYGKRTPRMMMDTVGVIAENSYHSLSSWGMDILAVGKSLGAGSLALSIPGVNGKDTLVRLGGGNIETITYEKVADGPVRAMLKMHYKKWKAVPNIPPIEVTEELSIWGGKYFYQSRVNVNNAPLGAKLVTGIVNLYSKKSVELNVEACKVLYTYDVQSENKDQLGLALLVQDKQFGGYGKTPVARSDVLNTYTVSLPLSSQPAEYRFYAGWELSDLLFTKEENFKRFLQYEAEKYSKPLVTGWK